jgi:hypothetical protein
VGGVVIGSVLTNASRPAYGYYPAPAPVYAYPAPAYVAPPPPVTYYTAPAPAPTTYYTAPAPTYYTAPTTTYTAPATTTYSYAPSTTYSTTTTQYAASSPHIDWCYANRPGFNPADNTFQPAYGGAREFCQSPYSY